LKGDDPPRILETFTGIEKKIFFGNLFEDGKRSIITNNKKFIVCKKECLCRTSFEISFVSGRF